MWVRTTGVSAESAEVHNRLRFKSELEHALLNEELTVDYQPTFTLDHRAVTGFEALVRWRHPSRGIPQADFIPLAEATGLIVPQGNWVLRTACAQQRSGTARSRRMLPE